MKSVGMRSGLLALLILLAVSAACTNADQLSSGVGEIPVQVAMVNTETRFERARFDVSQVTVRPLDPDASDALGTDPLGMLRSTDVIEVDFNVGDETFQTESPLTVGLYEVQSIVFANMEFDRGERLGVAACEEYITDYPLVPGPVRVSDFGVQVIVEVTLGTDNRLRMLIDGGNLTAAFETSWRCAQGAACGGLPPWPIWCLLPNNASAFSNFDFAELSPTYLSFP